MSTNHTENQTGQDIVPAQNGFVMTAQNYVEHAAVVAAALAETVESKDNAVFPKSHKAVLSTDKKLNQELGHGLFLFKVQVDSISVVDLS